jgi:dTMP kinase
MSIFISFEGPEGSGKTTQANRLKKALKDRKEEVILTREPGGTPIGDAVREILLNPDYDDMTALTELFLYEASRSQHVSGVIEPALDNGKIVISDRFTDASLIYQGIARQVGLETVKSLNNLATHSVTPDLTVILDVEPGDGLDRARETSDNYTKDGDRIEQESSDFHRRVREGYRELAQRESNRCILLSRDQSIDSIHNDILNHVEALLDE